jgi:hypothetical protein
MDYDSATFSLHHCAGNIQEATQYIANINNLTIDNVVDMMKRMLQTQDGSNWWVPMTSAWRQAGMSTMQIHTAYSTAKATI